MKYVLYQSETESDGDWWQLLRIMGRKEPKDAAVATFNLPGKYLVVDAKDVHMLNATNELRWD